MTSPAFTRAIELTPEHPPEEIAALAALAESVGFEAAFTSSHYFNRDPFVTLASMAARTEDLALGPGIVNPYDAHPVTLAARTATLAEVSDGRALFGIGAGDRSTLRTLGIERERPLRRVLETAAVARDLWAGETVTHEGTFTARDVSLNLEPCEVPVYVGAQGPDMLRMAGKHADGVLVNASHPADLEWASARVAEGAAEREAARDPVSVLAWASVSIAEDADAAREAARPPVAFITGDVAPPVLERHGIDAEAAAGVSEALERGALGEAFARVTPAMLDAFAVAGTPETVTERFASMLETVDGVVVGSPLGPDLETGIELAASALERVSRS
ncbi:5,10-methylenetetrahydromethanopterin reductase [Natronobiforma cellulositropha]|uniref:5,10-methylenetetrahydromethanopterin reductase n=1 Tax=Natronobiforma cellulositropha TaxID=1679076 RepID=UPI0021D5D778|nr:5,10-methylenetetrahydromethanopterin reductase [Natronobiforma cellulositropha]